MITSSSPKGKLSLAVIDDKGDTVFAYNESIHVSYRPYIGLNQLDSSSILEVTYVANLPTGVELYPEELYVETWIDGDQISYGSSQLGFEDVNEDGYISEGDTFNLEVIFSPSEISGYTVKIELTGGGGHNPETVVASIEVDIE
jgi:hypothetical protein